MDNPRPTQYCTFYLGELFLGVDVLEVQEVLLYQEMTRVPLASREILGLINLRGQTVTAIDLRRRLGLPDLPEEAEPPFNVVICSEDGAVSLLVDEIGDVIETDEADFEAPPETLDPSLKELVCGVFKLENQLLAVLDVERVVDTNSRLRSTQLNTSETL